MTYEEAVLILRKKGRVIAKLCVDTGLTRNTIENILSGKTKNPHHETALKIIKWVEEH